MRVYTCESGLELNGQTTRSLLENVNGDMMQPYLEAHGIVNITPEGWYPAQAVLDVMNDIARSGNSMSDFVAVGIKAAELSPLTPEIEQMSLDAFFTLYAQIFPQRHRNGNPGQIVVEHVNAGHVKMVMDVIYPDDVMYGLMFGYARRLIPPGMSFTVYYDEDITPMDAGGSETVLHITWGY